MKILFQQKFKILIGALLLLVLVIFAGKSVAYAATDPFTKSCSVSGASSSEFCKQKDTEVSDYKAGGGLLGKNSILTKVVQVLIVLIGAVSVIMIIIGGFRYVVSVGDSNGVAGAKNTILYAIVGLVIAIFGQLIIGVVLSRL